ncbi:MAG: TetR/AcrR family transcriptional regulator [Pseudomonadota bacterium]
MVTSSTHNMRVGVEITRLSKKVLGSRDINKKNLATQMVDAMLAELKQKTSNNVSVADLARSIGVSVGAPYRHFDDRDELLDHVAAVGFDQLRARMTKHMSKEEPTSVQRIVEGGLGYIFFSVENKNLFHVMWDGSRRREPHFPSTGAGERAYATFIANLVVIMHATGHGEQDPMAFGSPLWTMVHGYASLLVANERMLDPSENALREQISVITHRYFNAR